MDRITKDFEYIWLNRIVTFIPSWTIRKYFFKKSGLRISKDARIGIGTIILNPSGISIGERTIINEFCVLDGRGGLRIEHDTSISMYSKIITASHRLHSNDFKYYNGGVFISSNVWIGVGAIILDGSLIEERSVIGAGAVIKGSVSKNSVMVGNPAKKIKDRDLRETYKIEYKPYFR